METGKGIQCVVESGAPQGNLRIRDASVLLGGESRPVCLHPEGTDSKVISHSVLRFLYRNRVHRMGVRTC